MGRWLKGVADWLDARLGFREYVLPVLKHPIPKGAAGPMGWWYVFGSASMTLLMIQVITGIGLALVYVPSADRAYDSLLYLNYEHPAGWFLRALHYYAGSGMVVMVLAHLTQVFLHGAYKYPRELTWVIGVLLLLCTLGMFFSGQILRWDPDAYWGLAVAGSMAGRVPVLGPEVVRLVLGGPVIGGDALSRFFTLHVFVIPGSLLAFLAVHLWLVLRRGISEPPVSRSGGRPQDLRRGIRGGAEGRGSLSGRRHDEGRVLLGHDGHPRGGLGGHDRSQGPVGPSRSCSGRCESTTRVAFSLVVCPAVAQPGGAETFIILVFPVILIVALLFVPFFSNRGERAPSRRPVAVLAVIVIYTVLGVLTYQGVAAPWSPQMTAWSGDPIPTAIVRESTPLQLQGALVFQNKNCRNCHALEGIGGQRGPDLTTVGTRLTRDQLIDQVSNGTPGGGNMPAYGKQLNPAEMTTLAEFLVSLRPSGQPPARSAADGP